MELRPIYTRRAREEAQRLLIKEDITMDKCLECTIGLYDEEDRLTATGSYFRNTLRCLAVDSDYQGEGLMAQVVSELVTRLYALGRRHLFVYTKRTAAPSIAALGFYPIAESGGAVFLENRRTGFEDYLQSLGAPRAGVSGAVVMNANPFTLGHLYLAETAAAGCDTLHLFMVSEDLSAFPFAARERLIREGTRHIPNIVYHPTESYLVSAAVFPSYFIKDQDDLTMTHAQLDARIFGRIAAALHITRRFVGEEPFSPATALYNRAMAEALPEAGVALTVLTRKKAGGEAVSASRVRALIKEGRLDDVRPLVPETTFRFLQSGEGAAIVQAIMDSSPPPHP